MGDTNDQLAQYVDPNRPGPCDDCGRRPVPSRLAPGRWIDVHAGTCPKNGALQVCERCSRCHADLDFGEALACIMDVSLDEGREMQRRIVDRITRAASPSETDHREDA